MQRCNHRPPATLSELAPAARSLVTWRDSEVGYHRWWRPGPAPIEAVGRRALAPVLKPKERSAWSCVSACAGHSGIKHDRQRRARPRDAPTRPRWRTAAALPAGPSANFHWPVFAGDTVFVENQIRTYSWCKPPRIGRQRIRVPVENQMRIYWWCSPLRIGRQRYDSSRWRRWHSPNTTTWSRHSRRIEPISRSAYPFCHGDRGDVGRSRMPIDRTRRMKTSP
jgi:hypothetical protein